MRKISKELYNNLDLTNIDIAGQSLKYRGLMVFLDKEDEELENAIEEAGKIAYLVVSEEDLKEPEKKPEELKEDKEEVKEKPKKPKKKEAGNDEDNNGDSQ